MGGGFFVGAICFGMLRHSRRFVLFFSASNLLHYIEAFNAFRVKLVVFVVCDLKILESLFFAEIRCPGPAAHPPKVFVVCDLKIL